MLHTGTNTERAAELLRQGQLVAIPTETVYGLAGNALNEAAVVKIFEVKNRPRFNPLIVHLASAEQINSFASEFSPSAKKLAEAFMPGSLTLLLPKKEIISDLVTAGSQFVALRVPKHPLTQKLLSLIDFPLAAPSANPFGYISPTNAAHVQKQLGEQVSYILDGGACEVGIESTIAGFDEHDNPVIYRQGAVTSEHIESVTGKKISLLKNGKDIAAPGMLKSHYSPAVPLLLGNIEELAQKHTGKNILILSFQKKYSCNNIVLSPTGDLYEAARNLFASLRKSDEQKPDLIIAEKVPDEGIGRAINDRLKRASA